MADDPKKPSAAETLAKYYGRHSRLEKALVGADRVSTLTRRGMAFAGAVSGAVSLALMYRNRYRNAKMTAKMIEQEHAQDVSDRLMRKAARADRKARKTDLKAVKAARKEAERKAKENGAKSIQTGARGGVFYVTRGGTKVYVKR